MENIELEETPEQREAARNFIEERGVFAKLCVGSGLRISLKTGKGKYPPEEFWCSPEEASVIYQKSGGRNKFETKCYSNIYPREALEEVEAAVNVCLTKLEAITGQQYPRGIIANGAGVGNLTPEAIEMLDELGANTLSTLENLGRQVETLNAIASASPSELGKRKKHLRKLTDKIKRERESASATRLLQKQFNRKTAARAIEITGAGTFDAFNTEGTRITPVYEAVKKLEKEG